MASRQPASCSFCAMAQAMLLLFASPNITAVFCVSLTFPLVSSAFSSTSHSPITSYFSNPMKCPLNLLHRIPQHYGPPMRTTHGAIRLCQRTQQPLHLRLVQRHVHFNRRVARCGCRNLRLQGIDRKRGVFALDSINNFDQQMFRV